MSSNDNSNNTGTDMFAEVAVTQCPSCGDTVPQAPFCGACGHHLHGRADRPGKRWHAFAAAPGEHVLHLSVITSLFPQLPHRSRAPFRLGFAVFSVVLVVLAMWRLQAPLIAVSAFGLPLLFQIYLHEVDVYEREHAVRVAGVALVGAGFGVGWALLIRDTVARALAPSLFNGGVLASTDRVLTAIAFPAIIQLLMFVPVVASRLLRPPRTESMDGFIYGSASGLGVAVGATLAQLAPLLRHGVRSGGSVSAVVTEGLIHGVSVPLLAAGTTGLFGAAIWVQRRRPAPRRSGLTTPALVAVIAVAVQIGLGVIDVDQPGNSYLALAHVGAALLFLLVLRVGLHHVLLDEANQTRQGPPRVCAHCSHVVPTMPFCPHCGVAGRATSRRARDLLILGSAEGSA